MATKTGTAGSDTLYGGGPDTLVGREGDDVYVIYSQADTVVESPGEGRDTVYAFASYTLATGASVELLSTATNAGTASINLGGNALSQTIVGNYGANILNGYDGADTLVGLRGDDIYRVYSQSDVVVEVSDEGDDQIYTSASYSLAADASVETLSTAAQGGTEALNLLGNGFAQRLIGNYGANILNGNGGSDTLIGLGGDDIYRVYGMGDVVIEAPDEGNDTIYTSASYALTGIAAVETLSTAVQAETAALNLIGNGFGQRLIGNNGNNVLNGNGGVDTLIGLKGDDTYVVGNAASTVAEAVGDGSDTVYANVSYVLAQGTEVETLSTQVQGGGNAINLSGNELAQLVIGNYGDNIIDGGGAADTLIGLAGADTFRFSSALGGGNIDTILDYGTGSDLILLDAGIFSGMASGTVAESAIAIGAAPADADDRIIYDPLTGALSFDADGSGSAATMQFAVLSKGLNAAQLNLRVDAAYTATISSPVIQEGNSGTQSLIFTVTLDHAAVAPFSLSYATITGAGTTADQQDYAPVQGTINFTAGQTSATLPVSVFGDSIFELNETIQLQVSGGPLSGTVTSTGSILNDDMTAHITGGGTFLAGGATGSGVSLDTTYAGATAIIFEAGNSFQPHNLVFGPNSAASGHPTITFDSPFAVGTFDFSQLGTGLVGDAASYRTSGGATIIAPPPSDSLTRTPRSITGSSFADLIDLSSMPLDNGRHTIALNGGAGNDVLRGGLTQNGGEGDDRLVAIGLGTQMTGSAGSDTFVIPVSTRTPGTISGSTPNRLIDFTPGTDHIQLVVSQGDTAYLPLGALDASRFAIGAATTADQRIIYNADTGQLFFDRNGSEADLAGNGQVPLFAQLPTQLELSAASFMVVAA